MSAGNVLTNIVCHHSCLSAPLAQHITMHTKTTHTRHPPSHSLDPSWQIFVPLGWGINTAGHVYLWLSMVSRPWTHGRLCLWYGIAQSFMLLYLQFQNHGLFAPLCLWY
ncbi:hypothetical protein BKA70DRAFT_1328416, partial [Coprinopsis sp. MPI-PUGE-AT-0042]